MLKYKYNQKAIHVKSSLEFNLQDPCGCLIREPASYYVIISYKNFSLKENIVLLRAENIKT
jgi:hypothetical protein